MFRYILAFLLLITATHPVGTAEIYPINISSGHDGFTYERKTAHIEEAKVHIYRFNSVLDLTAYINEKYPEDTKEGQLLGGFTVALQGSNGKATCKIYIIDPSKQYIPEYIGHELVHCIDGRFHK